jgi:hypothetical protein
MPMVPERGAPRYQQVARTVGTSSFNLSETMKGFFLTSNHCSNPWFKKPSEDFEKA